MSSGKGAIEMEIWRTISINSNYMVSSYGRVKSLRRTIYQSNGHPMTFPEKILKPLVSDNGYLYVDLAKNGKYKAHKVHRLVAETFLQVYSSEKTQVHHKDHCRMNNHLSNLMWVSPKENSYFNPKLCVDSRLRDKHGKFIRALTP